MRTNSSLDGLSGCSSAADLTLKKGDVIAVTDAPDGGNTWLRGYIEADPARHVGRFPTSAVEDLDNRSRRSFTADQPQVHDEPSPEGGSRSSPPPPPRRSPPPYSQRRNFHEPPPMDHSAYGFSSRSRADSVMDIVDTKMRGDPNNWVSDEQHVLGHKANESNNEI